MKRMSIFKSVGYTVIVSVSLLLIVACSESSELSRSMAKDLILSNSEYPQEITKDIMVEYSTGANSLEIETYASELKRLGLASAEIAKKKDSFAGLLTFTSIKVILSDEGKKYIRGEEKGDRGKIFLTVLSYFGRFGEVTGLIFLNEQKTSAVAEYTELYEPTPFALIEIPFHGNHKQPETVNKKAYFQMYDDGWRVARVE